MHTGRRFDLGSVSTSSRSGGMLGLRIRNQTQIRVFVFFFTTAPEAHSLKSLKVLESLVPDALSEEEPADNDQASADEAI